MLKVIIHGLFLLSVFQLTAQSINTDNSIVNFEISNMKINAVEGTFKGMSGTIKFDPDNLKLSDFDVCIDASTVNTGNKKRDAHLLTADFFNAEKYPKICFQSTLITRSGHGYEVKGKLTMHGVVKDVTIPFAVSGSQLTGTLKVKRLDYKIGEETGTFMVGDEVDITITCVLD
ncbi:YceI family protein [Fulvivirga ulvae]|uniref:YceI family protein n=1 Tax=Fulvivirga ulvae TaxID=2904245 RepID=UPI001F336727|nr:YceI family protein [Fulvivirga ulvae]UII29586.1 YceI family protein [Fulvivirga ulvae]